MKLVYHSQRSIPRLAWCAVLRKGSPEVHVYHGTSVEVQEAFFVEGAWDGDFTAVDCTGLFDQSSFLLGTGGKLLQGGRPKGRSVRYSKSHARTSVEYFIRGLPFRFQLTTVYSQHVAL